MRIVAIVCGVVAIVGAQCSAAGAQQKLTIQEPSIEQFGVGTTVSAPDSGRGLAGSVRRRGTAKSRFGRLPAGSNMNFAGEGGLFGAEVRVHDAEEKDLEARDLAEKARKERDRSSLSPDAARAYQTLKSRGAARNLAPPQSANLPAAPRVPPAEKKPDDGPSAEKLLERAKAAEASGKRQLALSFLRVARDRGSAEAARELERIGAKK